MTFLFLKLGCVEMLSYLNSGCIMYNVYDNAQLLPGKCYLDIFKLIKCSCQFRVHHHTITIIHTSLMYNILVFYGTLSCVATTTNDVTNHDRHDI